MAESKSFSISRKGYSCAEVDEFIAASDSAQAQLRESYASLQAKYDGLFEENGKLIKEREQLRQGCKTMAAALVQLRDNSTEDYKAKYEEAIAQLEKLRAEQSTHTADSSSATQMIEEVAQVVKRIEVDARRKADAITSAAKLEQTQAKLISSRVTDEVKSLIRMLEGFVADHVEIEETEE
ncbi:MAG: hypothetical protein J6B25_09390 [Clostridia bacterium]|nr:hypothetical protein [Clostridia bacterium]